MNDDELEQRLRSRRAAPSGNLRERVLAAVRTELRAEPATKPADRPASRAAWLTLTAAALVVWLHLSWSATLRTRFPGAESVDGLAGQVARMQELAPELSETEARRMAIVMGGGRW